MHVVHKTLGITTSWEMHRFLSEEWEGSRAAERLDELYKDAYERIKGSLE